MAIYFFQPQIFTSWRTKVKVIPVAKDSTHLGSDSVSINLFLYNFLDTLILIRSIMAFGPLGTMFDYLYPQNIWIVTLFPMYILHLINVCRTLGKESADSH